MSILRRIIERGIARREFRRTGAVEFPQLIFGPVLAAIIWNLMFNKLHPIDFDAYSRAHIDLVINGLKAAKSK